MVQHQYFERVLSIEEKERLSVEERKRLNIEKEEEIRRERKKERETMDEEWVEIKEGKGKQGAWWNQDEHCRS